MAAAPAPQAQPAECVCPRCGLHFQPEKTAQQTAAKATERHRVLVVEDQEYFREIARDALSEKFEVTTAENAEDAWRALAAGGISLLVLDLTLGGSESGRRLLEQIKVKPCPVLIFTSRDESEMYGDEWDELQALGADDMVIKGMNVGESLMRKVCELLDCTDDSIDLD
ncbi:hypothetical protein ABI59_12670 [Acidobacteria bacterium Mor1]|nr:hypothetical protein ABI59_12670 [Acidobacteria bacterium Mor1]